MLHCLVRRINLDQVNGRLNHSNTRRDVNVEYRHLSIGSNGHVRFTNMQLQYNDDVRIKLSIFGLYNFEGASELDTTLVRYVHTIWIYLIRSMAYKEIKT